MRTVISGAKIILPDEIVIGKHLVLDDAKITGIFDTAPVGADKHLTLNGLFVSPGFVDLHVHGGGGYDFNDATEEAFRGAATLHMQHGTTSIMPTVVACANEELFSAIECYGRLIEKSKNLPNFLGLHLEGPYISPNQAGAIDPDYIKNPEESEYERILQFAGLIGRMTVAPELMGAMELGNRLKQLGIMASIGHSDAEYDTVLEATEHGYTHITHLYSAMSTLRRINAYRKLGVLESAYLLDDLSVEIIADGKHLPLELLKLILKAKDADKICLITDAMRGAGLPNGTKTLLGSLKNGQEVVIEDDVAFMPDKSCFAGSVCTTDRCVRTLHKQVGLPLEKAVRMITLNPCKFIGLEARKGSIAAGKDADLVAFDEDIQIKNVLVMGVEVFQNN